MILRPDLARLLFVLLCAALPFGSFHASKAGAVEAPALELRVLGSGGPGAGGRAGAGYVLLLDGQPRVLVDAGPGTFVRLGEARLDLRQLDTVLLTHLHVDHVGELPGIVKARAVSARRAIDFKVFGPDAGPGFPSTRQLIDRLFGDDGAFPYLQAFAGRLTFHTTNLFPRQTADSPTPLVIVDQDGLKISALPGHHRDAPAVIYRIDYKGKSLTFSGDIDPQGHAALTRIAQGSDLLVFNAVVLDPPGSPAVLYDLHTAPTDIGQISAAAGVSRLLLSHLSADIDQARDAVTTSIHQSFNGPVQFAEDGQRLDF